MNLSAENFASIINEAFGFPLDPPFDPYRDSLSFMLGSYVVPYVGLTGYTGANPFLCGYLAKRLLAGLLSAESGQDAIIRAYLFERANETVQPYNYTVAEFTIRISDLRNRLGMCRIKDEGLIVPQELGAEGRISTNILSLNPDSLSYPRSPEEVLRIVYQTGNESEPGGFYPLGANGRIACQLLGDFSVLGCDQKFTLLD